jgi:hypothetical protein
MSEEELKIVDYGNTRSTVDSSSWRFTPKSRVFINDQSTSLEYGNIDYDQPFPMFEIPAVIRYRNIIFTVEKNLMFTNSSYFFCLFFNNGEQSCHVTFGEMVNNDYSRDILLLEICRYFLRIIESSIYTKMISNSGNGPCELKYRFVDI